MRRLCLAYVLPLLLAAGCGEKLTPLPMVDGGGSGGDDLSIEGDGGGKPMDMATVQPDFQGAIPDTDGPEITIVRPLGDTFVGGIMELAVKITDPSGVNMATVNAIIGGNPANKVPLTLAGADVYHAFVDFRKFGRTYSFLDISVRAEDKLKNASSSGWEVLLDNTPPWMTMDAKIEMRVSKLDNATVECSQLFSPLGPHDPLDPNGPEAAFDGAVVKQAIGLRARIEDHGNHVPGQRVDFISDIDGSTVMLYVVGSTPSLPVLAVDTDGDGVCDDVNPLLVPTTDPVVMSNQTLALQMIPVTDTGNPDYRPDSAPLPSECGELGDANAKLPAPLCSRAGTGVTFIIPWYGKLKPIYTLPIVRDPDSCVGYPLDSANYLPEGPACAISRAADNTGNVMVSYPLHICIDRGGGKCNSFTPNATDCTGKFDKSTGMLVSGTCSEAPVGGNPGTFPKSGEVRHLPKFTM